MALSVARRLKRFGWTRRGAWFCPNPCANSFISFQATSSVSPWMAMDFGLFPPNLAAPWLKREACSARMEKPAEPRFGAISRDKGRGSASFCLVFAAFCPRFATPMPRSASRRARGRRGRKRGSPARTSEPCRFFPCQGTAAPPRGGRRKATGLSRLNSNGFIVFVNKRPPCCNQKSEAAHLLTADKNDFASLSDAVEIRQV